MDTAGVTFSSTNEPYAEAFEDSYYSRHDGLGESQHVFINGNDLPRRLREHSRRAFTVGELGFGTGLNFLLTWRALLENADSERRLHYWSVEACPLSKPDLETSLARWPELADLAGELEQAYPPPVPGVHRRLFAGGRIVLDLVWANAADAIAELRSLSARTIDAWYLDGFAPSRNAAMWSPEVLQGVADTCRENATAATYSVAAPVRQGLANAGFRIEKKPGFGRKRECLTATLVETRSLAPSQTPWDLPANKLPDGPSSAVVIGAGLAGAHLASAMARRGTQVTVLDEGSVAGRASGNAQGVLFNRLSPERSALSDFSLHANLFASALYSRMFESGDLIADLDGALSGCLLTGEQAQRVDAESLAELTDIAGHLDQAGASKQLGTALASGALWQPGSGWLSPPRLCAALLRHPLISVRENCGPLAYHRGSDNEEWVIVDSAGQEIARTSTLLVAAGIDTRTLELGRELPLGAVRGQTTQIPVPSGQRLKTSFCHRGYITPAVNGEHCIGATFYPKDDSRELRAADHEENIERLAQALPDWAAYLHSLDAETLTGRAEVRCVSPDYLPIAGPAPDAQAFAEAYGALGKDATRLVPDQTAYMPGLFLSTAHGSRGLSYSALAAELIASQLWGEPIPASRQIQQALSPARFQLRAIIRGTYKGDRENHGT